MTANADPLLLLRPRDPLIVRDARPFAAEPGARAVSLPWPLPGTVAGALRGHIGNTLGWNWSQQTNQAAARAIALTAYFRLARAANQTRWSVYLPAPRDAVLYTNDDPAKPVKQMMCLRPADPTAGAGCSWPDGATGLLPLHVTEERKPDPGNDAWSYPAILRWLAAGYSEDRPADADLLGRVPRETRTHVKIDYAKGAADPGFLFATEGLAFAPAATPDHHEAAILCRLANPPAGMTWQTAFLPLGGERRQTLLEPFADTDVPIPVPVARTPPREIIDALAGQTRLRLLLLTPAFFSRGWLPGVDDRSSRLAGLLPNATLTLAGAALDRRIPVSGWDMVARAPKPTRYAVPAGSVYFYDLDHPLTAPDIEALWLASIADADQDRADGYGIALPGVWSPPPEPSRGEARA